MSALPPCAGLWRLFDSTDDADHERAAALCATCPMIDACRERRDLAARKVAGRGHPMFYGPRGTWAGELVRHNKSGSRRPEAVAFEDGCYTADQARAAHAAYARGERDEWTITGERVYQRDRKRRNRLVLTDHDERRGAAA